MLDVARRAGVSRSLVSTVFRGVPGASPETRARVLAAAADLGYRPDDRARKLRSFSSSDIGVTLTAVNPFHVAVTDALHQLERLRGFELTISWTSDVRPLDSAVEALLEQRCAALLLMGPTDPAEQIDALRARAPEVPLIVADRYLDLTDVDTLRVDDAAALLVTIGHLVDLGHRDIVYIDGGDFVSAEPRRLAYEAAAEHFGLPCTIWPGGGTRTDGIRAAAEIMSTGRLPLAIMAYNDQVAFGVMDVLIRRGVRIPEDVSIVGFDNVEEAGLPDIALTTIEQRADCLAVQVAETLLARIGGATPGGLRLLAPGPLIVRSTTGPPAARP
jgi:DNA-binding LacI/PurR family transcriptional regulator